MKLSELHDLAVGDLVELPPIFPKLSREPVVLKVIQKSGDRAEFVSTYFGVTLGKWVATVVKGGIEWSTK